MTVGTTFERTRIKKLEETQMLMIEAWVTLILVNVVDWAQRRTNVLGRFR